MLHALPQDAIYPSLIPFHTLPTGARIPAIGFGTFGSDHVSAEDVAIAVEGAIRFGYRHIDCAGVYGNEPQIGSMLSCLFREGLAREELWITSKLWNDCHAPELVIPRCRQALNDLQLDYLDLYLIHWPFPNHHPPGCDVHVRAPNAQPYIHENYMRTWRELEKLVEMELVRHIGCSNMTIPKLELLLRDARIRPVVNEMELHPHFQQPELFNYVVRNGLVPIGYSPLGSPGRPDRDRTHTDTIDMEDPVILRIAKRLGLHPSGVCLKWAVQRGHIPIPFSSRPRNYQANLRAVIDPALTAEDMAAIATIDRNCRLIKGQVFLWKDGQTWEDLWDLNGRITPA